MEKINFDQISRDVLDFLENSLDHVFLTGNAGTGKSTLLDHFRNHTKKNIAVIAPTGVAAVNVRGETIHSFFKFPPNVTPEHAIYEAKKVKNPKIYKALDTLVIDEISMVRADLMDSIDSFLKTIRHNQSPFGGVQIVMVGDLHQLPPVVTRDEQEMIDILYSSPYFFSSKAFSSLIDGLYPTVRFFELMNIYRQSEKKFIEILNKIRTKTATQNDLDVLNNCQISESDIIDNHILLTAINEQADKVNEYRLSEIEGPVISYHATVSGEFNTKQSPAADVVSIKTGARVMLLNNDSENRWINGTIGTVYKATRESALVKLDNGELELVEPVTWNSYKTTFNHETASLESKETGSFKQLPLRLAWAITIHKSQGKTFDNVAIDLGRGAFAHGQTYVALSRCRSLSGLKLLRPLLLQHVIMDDRVVSFMDKIRQLAGQS